MKIYRDKNNNIHHIVFQIGKMWIGFDKTGIMGWTGTRNFYYIFSK